MSHILALDLGTSAVKCLLMDSEGAVLQVHSEGYPSQFPQPGWMEQQPDDWVTAAVKAANQCMNLAGCRDISVISLSGHMSALVVVDENGDPLFPCITLSDSRSREQAQAMSRLAQEHIYVKTGNPVVDAFQAPKLLWLKEHHPGIYDRAHLFLFPKDYLRYRLTGKFGTDFTDAGNSLFFDPVQERWDDEIIGRLALRPSLMPRLFRPYEIAGTLTRSFAHLLGLTEGIPVAAGAADIAAAALGTGAVSPDEVVLTIGTNATMLSVVPDFHPEGIGKVTFHPHAHPGMMYALGSHFSGGHSLNWFSNLFQDKVDYAQLQAWGAAAAKVPIGSHGALYMPFLIGSGSPHYDPHMQGAFLGLNNSADRGTLFRAVLEGISYNLKETLVLLERMSRPADRIRLGGGGAKIKVWPQILANIFDKPVQMLKHADASAIGAAMIGGHAVGIFPDLKEISSRLAETADTIEPEPAAAKEYAKRYAFYQNCYSALEALYQTQP
jgi:xylulokinase